MPILKENKKLYPANWKEIREEYLNLCGGECEFCGIHEGDYVRPGCGSLVVLTIAHLDHDPTNNVRQNLRALCQKCHNKHDAKYRAITRKIRKINAENSGRLELK